MERGQFMKVKKLIKLLSKDQEIELFINEGFALYDTVNGNSISLYKNEHIEKIAVGHNNILKIWIK